MSSQITTPLATYKILNAINDVKKVTKNVMDYYVEMVLVASGENMSYRYKIYVNYINGIKIVGNLCAYDAEDQIPGMLITAEQIPGVILSHGKLFSTSGTPYYVEIWNDDNPINTLTRLVNDDKSVDTFCITWLTQ